MVDDVFGIVGEVLAGSFHVEQVVAEGGFGVVYRAEHAGFRAPVALKCLKIPGQLSDKYKREFLEQFRAEAELLFRLSAALPTVVRPLHVDAVTLDSGLFVPFLAMEWLEGETLDAILLSRAERNEKPIGLRKLVRMLTPVARALERAHNFGGETGEAISIVHRDLKPENIFVAKVAGEEVVKILDFGIGKAKSVASQVAGKASQTGAAFTSFSPAYGAPEQWVPKRFGQTGPWTDVWGLALTMVEVLVGRTVLDGDHAAIMGTALDTERRPTPRNEGVEVSDDVEKVFECALAVDPRDRYTDCGKFWNALERAMKIRASRQSNGPRPRDERAEAGFVPHSERVEAVKSIRPRSVVPRAASPEAATLAAVEPIVDEPSVNEPPAISAEIPDLSLEAPAPQAEVPLATFSTTRRRKAGQQRRTSGQFALDDGPAVDIALDLESKQSSWPAPKETPSGQWPAPGQGGGPGTLPPASPSAAQEVYQRVSRESLPRLARTPEALEEQVTSAEPNSLKNALLPGFAVLGLSVALTLVDQIYASMNAEVLSLGPLRLTWIAGTAMVIGLVLLGLGLVRHVAR